MTARRVFIIFVAAFVAIAGSAWLSSRRHLDRSMLSGELILPSLRVGVNGVTQIHLTKAGNINTTLRKTGERWIVVERDYAADPGKVRKLLLDLASMQIVEEKTSTPANYPAIGVQDLSVPQAPATRIDLTVGANTDSLLIGNASGQRSSFVRDPRNARSLLATPRPSADAEPAQWIDKALLTLPARRIRQATFTAPAGSYSIARDKPEQVNFVVSGVPKNRQLSGEAAGNASAASLDRLTIDDVRTASVEPANAVHASFTTFDGLTVTATGHTEGDRRFIAFAAVSATDSQQHEATTLRTRFAGREFEIAPYKYDAIFRSLEELLEKRPEPQTKQPRGKAPLAGADQ